ncbi:MAG TPA: DUF4440 domain-containing protein [Acidobacteriota bacterium]|nr:DUF4440 domain-containing protein [Acidobacteriota bacterium]HNT17250.1 DUF4440 domain-containing protein [Acidobacteriota bacterium]
MKKNLALIVVMILSFFLLNSLAAQEVKPEAKPESRAEPKQEVKPEATVDPNQEKKPEAMQEAKPEGKIEPAPQAKPERKTDPRAQGPRTTRRGEPKPAAAPQATPAPAANPQQPAPAAAPAPEAKPQQPAPAPTAKPEVKQESNPAASANVHDDEDYEDDTEGADGEEEDEDDNCSVLEIESKFNQIVREAGTGPAFKAFFSKDSIVVASTIIEGKTYAEAAEAGQSIVFRPFSVKVSSACDYGYVVGDWEETRNGKVIWGGQYVNVWKKVKKEWKIIIHAKNNLVRGYKTEKRPPVTEIGSQFEKKGLFAGNDIDEIEKELFGALKRGGWAKAYDSFADNDIMKIRHNGPMIRGKKQVFLKSVVERGFLEGNIVRTMTAKGRDIAVVWGGAEAKGPQPYQRGTFLHVWNRDNEGSWKLAVDFLILGGNEFKKSIL